MNKDRSAPIIFSEQEAQRILARAAELEGAIGNRFTADDLRQIAATAGIDSRALEHAMNEQGEVTPSGRSAEPLAMSAKQVALLAGSGAALGAMAVVADNMSLGNASAIAGFGPSALYTLWRALRHPLGGGLSGLWRELGVVFGSFTLAIIASQGVQDSAPAITWSLICGFVGTAVLSLRGGSTSLKPASDEVR